MIKSKYDIFWVGFLTFMLCWCFLFFVISFSQFLFHYKILGMGMLVDKDALPLCLIALTGLLFFCLFLWREANIVTIDTSHKIITFKNIFTRQTEKFYLTNFLVLWIHYKGQDETIIKSFILFKTKSI